MSEWILIFLLIPAVLVIIALLLTIIVYKKKKEGKLKELNYQVFFNVGIIWIPVGVVFMITINNVMGIAFMALGISYMAIGLANRNKWEKKDK
jgi:hypothetical protein